MDWNPDYRYLVRQFYLWVMREPEAAAQWLKGETERKKV